MANESPMISWGWGISGFDARNSTNSGTTRGGPSGSGQFLAVIVSTAADLTVLLSTVAGDKCIGILQNKPSTGIAANVAVFGMSKAVAGATITAGQELMNSSTQAGALIPVTTGLSTIGRALQAAS